MYLPTFQKITHELILRRGKVALQSLIVGGATFGPFLLYN
jgi:hypothetical protein